ncbi:Uncharacterised protein [Neisseria elongata subsp. glycolytica]|uniref:Uncharacterized protein n=1 Tax=Neisseria elongata subsp. glycolytica ATCC 29315 TaxID=546263 RepID=D4DSK0_NEIEG|nr:hypothetical protein NEIELOOT_02045 [Neisseria elongata subsp. glycolytica ATCC 29315]SQH49003.1 Uncharacterised protein [Neisseria elongata subsp. glycolytica]
MLLLMEKLLMNFKKPVEHYNKGVQQVFSYMYSLVKFMVLLLCMANYHINTIKVNMVMI